MVLEKLNIFRNPFRHKSPTFKARFDITLNREGASSFQEARSGHPRDLDGDDVLGSA